MRRGVWLARVNMRLGRSRSDRYLYITLVLLPHTGINSVLVHGTTEHNKHKTHTDATIPVENNSQYHQLLVQPVFFIVTRALL